MSPWFKHVNATKKAHPSKSLKEVLIMASKSYKKTGNSMKKTTNKSHKKKRSKSMKKNTNKSHKKKGGKSLKKTRNKSHKKKRSKSLKKKSGGGGKPEEDEQMSREQLVEGPQPSKLGLGKQHEKMWITPLVDAADIVLGPAVNPTRAEEDMKQQKSDDL